MSLPGPDVHKRDRILEVLLTPGDEDGSSSSHVAAHLRRMDCISPKSDYLPCGKHSSPSAADIDATISTPKHNKFSESVFGILHHLSVNPPNASILTNEAFIIFSLNQTLAWLEQNPIADRNKLIQDGRTLAVSIKKKFMQRKQEIRQRKTEALAKGKEDK